MPNRLSDETSPYLLQHANNPVDWYPWGPEALERARSEDKPIFLSVGYSACHWCHVMERECFESPEIAALMNELFVNIKVDREERPDIDEIYMKAVHALSGQGGWPMSVFLTPTLQPFFGATYLPPVRAHGRPSFPDVLTSMADAWRSRREDVAKQAKQLTDAIVEEASADFRGELAEDVFEQSLTQLSHAFDPEWGGFGGAPKFPHAADIRILLRHYLRTAETRAAFMAVFTLDKMAAGGIYDQLGGGFHRYSTDERWLIPHFEKMLYDNALLVPAYLEAHLVTGEPRFAEIAHGCCEWALREMRTPQGAFASAQDADSEGKEGAFFVWTPEQIENVLGFERAVWACAYWGVTEAGNFEDGASALWRPDPISDIAEELEIEDIELEEAMEEARAKLFEARAQRPRPMTDDKVLASWNGLMISALAQSTQVLGEQSYLQAAQAAARYVLDGMRQDDGRLYATAREGRAHLDACLEDYVFLTQGLIDLYETDFDARWIREALALTETVETRFADKERGGYFTTGEGHEPLIARTKNLHDGALPAATGVQALNLARLGALTERQAWLDRAGAIAEEQAKLVSRHPRLFSQLLCAVDFLRAPHRQIVISGKADAADTQALLDTVRSAFVPQRVVALADADGDTTLFPLLQGRLPDASGARAFVCRDFVCEAPATSEEELDVQLRAVG